MRLGAGCSRRARSAARKAARPLGQLGVGAPPFAPEGSCAARPPMQLRDQQRRRRTSTGSSRPIPANASNRATSMAAARQPRKRTAWIAAADRRGAGRNGGRRRAPATSQSSHGGPQRPVGRGRPAWRRAASVSSTVSDGCAGRSRPRRPRPARLVDRDAEMVTESAGDRARQDRQPNHRMAVYARRISSMRAPVPIRTGSPGRGHEERAGAAQIGPACRASISGCAPANMRRRRGYLTAASPATSARRSAASSTARPDCSSCR